MWPLTVRETGILSASTHVTLEADVWYDQSVVYTGLPVIDGGLTQELGNGTVRSSVRVTIADEDGTLTPIHDTDPLAPMGQILHLAVTATYGVESVRIPLGHYRIQSVTSSAGWSWWKDRWLPRAGQVTVEAVDILQDIAEADLVGVWQPQNNATVWQETQRLCEGFAAIEPDSRLDVRLPQQVTYSERRLDTMLSLAGVVGATWSVTRDGAIQAIWPDATQDPVWDVPESVLAEVNVVPSRENVINQVVATGEATDSGPQVIGTAQIAVGPRRVNGPLHPKILRHSSSFYRTQAQAEKGAQTLLEKRRRTETVPVKGRLPWFPALDIGDTHNIPICPEVRVPGVLAGLQVPLLGGEMEAMWQVPRQMIDSRLVGRSR